MHHASQHDDRQERNIAIWLISPCMAWHGLLSVSVQRSRSIRQTAQLLLLHTNLLLYCTLNAACALYSTRRETGEMRPAFEHPPHGIDLHVESSDQRRPRGWCCVVLEARLATESVEASLIGSNKDVQRFVFSLARVYVHTSPHSLSCID
ncbi:hypothetical protein J3E69DRAFT_295467 [Trichoderma sp. SZMC 28015]